MSDDHKSRLLSRRVAAAWLLATTLLTSGCDVSAMSFVQDDRVRVVEPADRAVVTLPVTLRWEVEDFAVTGRDGKANSDSGYFAVFVDRPPIPPGRTLEWFVTQDESCGGSACGTIDNLANVYTTDRTLLELTQLHADSRKRDVERHEAIIVLMDGTGARIGESAFYVRFNFEREG